MKKTNRQNLAPSFPFYVDDWLSDVELGMVSLAAQGAWARLLANMYKMPFRGQLRKANGKQLENKEISKLLSIPEQECKQILDEIIGGGVCSTLMDGTIYSRRMVRDAEISASRAEAGRIGGSKPKPSKTEASRGRAHPSPTSSPIPTAKKEKEHETQNRVSRYSHLDPFPNKDIRENLDKLRTLMLKAHGKDAVLPVVGSSKWFRHLDALEKLVRLDGYSGADVVACLIWVLTEEKASQDGFCWRDQLKSLAQLRKHKPDGPTKFQQMHGAWRKATKGKSAKSAQDLDIEKQIRAAFDGMDPDYWTYEWNGQYSIHVRDLKDLRLYQDRMQKLRARAAKKREDGEPGSVGDVAAGILRGQ